MTDQLIADLTAARAEVEKGWRKNGFEDGAGNVCAVGAINRVTFGCAALGIIPRGAPQRLSRRNVAYDALRAKVPSDISVPEYNDDPATTRQEILNLFDKALADLGGLA